MKTLERGFSLMELLVVIAIIGVLSSVILASLGSARQRGNDAAIKTNLSTLQVQAEVYSYNVGSNTYGSAVLSGRCDVGSSMFGADATIKSALSAISSTESCASVAACSGGLGKAMNCTVHNVASPLDVSYAVFAKLSSGAYWCIDSTGANRQVAAPTDINTNACP